MLYQKRETALQVVALFSIVCATHNCKIGSDDGFAFIKACDSW